MSGKKTARLRRARRGRARISAQGVYRLCVHRTPRHTYAQIIAPNGAEVIASASTVESTFKKELPYGGNVAAASSIGRAIAERAQAAGVRRVAFDRSGHKYHGRVKALAEAAREGGLEF